MLTARVLDARTKLAKVQFEMNLKIMELELRAETSTPPEVREQCEAAVKDEAAAVDATVKECTSLLQRSLKIVTIL